MGILDKRDVYKPFNYPQFEDLHRKLYTGFWHPDEVSLDEDTSDFHFKLTSSEKEIVSRILKNFTQSEVHVACFWGDFVSSWMKQSEIQNVARYISGNETIHARAYDLLNTTLGLDDYSTLKQDPKLYARIQMLSGKKARSKEDILKQIFTMSVLGEGVCLFSSFITLFAFTKKNLLRGLGQIISWSTLDEQLHSEVGVILFNTLKKEYGLMTEEMQVELYAIAHEVVEMEHSLIDRVFEDSSTDVISKEEIKNYINHKANKQLKKVGLNKTFKVDKELLKKTEFFDIMINGESMVDFFANKSTEYSKGLIVFDNKVWE